MEEKKTEKNPTVKEVLETQKKDISWKREPWVGDDGFIYRVNRVKNKDGTYTVFNVRVGDGPLVKPIK